MRVSLTLWVVIAAYAMPARAELMLFAKYDWQDGARDVSGSPIRHDGILDGSASTAGGKLLLSRWDGVVIGQVPELNGTTQALFRFENVTFDSHGEGAVSHATVLIGDDMSFGAGVFFELPPVCQPHIPELLDRRLGRVPRDCSACRGCRGQPFRQHRVPVRQRCAAGPASGGALERWAVGHGCRGR